MPKAKEEGAADTINSPDMRQVTFTGDELRMRALIRALAAVQGKMEGAKKDSKNPHFKSKYASLHSSWLACRKLLAENGFAVIQLPLMIEGGAVSLQTSLFHEDGAKVECVYPVTYQPCNAPALGAALKYARRYSLETVVGITTEDDPEDDDGNNAPPAPAAARYERVERAVVPPPPAQIQGVRPNLTEQAGAYMTKIQGAKTWDDFMNVIAEAGDLVERIRVADKKGIWTARINELVAEKRTALEPAASPQQPEGEEGTDAHTEKGDFSTGANQR